MSAYLRQEQDKPLYPDLIWARPEQKALAGKLFIIGGNAHAIAAPGEAYQYAVKQGIGEVKVAMPDKTRGLLGPKVPIDIELVTSTPSGSFSVKAMGSLQAYCSWANATLFAGDIGRNSETAILLEGLAQKMPGLQIYTRDGVDYFYANPTVLFERADTLLVVSLAQLQKLCGQLKWPTAITASMGLEALCLELADITKTYPVYIAVLYGKAIVTAVGGQCVATTLKTEPHAWRLKTASAASVWWLQNPSRPLEAIATSVTQIQF